MVKEELEQKETHARKLIEAASEVALETIPGTHEPIIASQDSPSFSQWETKKMRQCIEILKILRKEAKDLNDPSRNTTEEYPATEALKSVEQGNAAQMVNFKNLQNLVESAIKKRAFIEEWEETYYKIRNGIQDASLKKAGKEGIMDVTNEDVEQKMHDLEKRNIPFSPEDIKKASMPQIAYSNLLDAEIQHELCRGCTS